MDLRLACAMIPLALGCSTDRVLGEADSGVGGQASGGAPGAVGGHSATVGGGNPTGGVVGTAGSSLLPVGTPSGGASTGGWGSIVPATGGAAPTGGANTGGTTSTVTSPSTCTGTLDAVSKTWTTCPATYCDAISWVKCDSVGAAITKTTATLTLATGGLWRITLDFDVTHGQTCYYEWNQLVAAQAYDDVTSFCGNTSMTISAGSIPAADSFSTDNQQVICDRVAGIDRGVSQVFPNDPATPTNCYNYFMNQCTPCCPSTDCSDKPDGYPGYACTPKQPASFPSMVDVHSMLDNPWCLVNQCISGQPQGGC